MTRRDRALGRRRGFVAAAGTAALFTALAFLFGIHAIAATGITITSGGCSGGGAGYCYNPESANGTTGSPVTWSDQSGTGHTATLCTSAACPGAPASSSSCDSFDVSVGSGGSGAHTFSNPGTCYYYCTIHGYALLHGKIVVTAASASPSPSPTPTPTRSTNGPSPSSPSTGGAPGPVGGVVILIGLVLLTVTALTWRRPRR